MARVKNGCCYRLNCVPQNLYVEVLTPVLQNAILCEDRITFNRKVLIPYEEEILAQAHLEEIMTQKDSHLQATERGLGTESSPKRSQPCRHLDFRLLVSKTEIQKCLVAEGCGVLLLQPKQTNTC